MHTYENKFRVIDDLRHESLIGVDYYHRDPNFIKFPGGEWHLRLHPNAIDPEVGYVRIYAEMHTPDAIPQLMLLVDAVRQSVLPRHVNLQLFMPYTPYARQDRIALPGEAHSSRAFARFINHLEFDSVVVMDGHSHVAPALIDNCMPTSQVSELLLRMAKAGGFQFPEGRKVIVAPDEGAAKKAQELTGALRGSDSSFCPAILQCYKKRDPSTGKLSGFGVADHTYDEIIAAGWNPRRELIHFVVADDICDGGGTFLHMRETISHLINRSRLSVGDEPVPFSLSLMVTHGIFSKGTADLAQVYDNIYCLYPWIEDPNITKI